MTQQEPPKIEFPCANYPIKVVGKAGEDLKAFTHTVMVQFDPSFDATKTTVNPSRNGRFESIRVSINATGMDQLEAIFKALKTNSNVQMVL